MKNYFSKKVFLHEFMDKAGMTLEQAQAACQTMKQFEKLKEDNKVCLHMEPEQENYFSVYGEPDTVEEKNAIIHEIDTYGLWYIVSEVRCKCCSKWDVADSVGMCIFNDPLDPVENPYIIDLMNSAIVKYNEGVN